MDVTNDDRCKQCLTSKFREHLRKSWTDGTEEKFNLQPMAQGILETEETYRSNSSESSRESSNCIGNNVSVPKISWFKSMSQIVGLTAVWQQSKAEGHSVGANTVNSAKTNSPVQLLFMRQ